MNARDFLRLFDPATRRRKMEEAYLSEATSIYDVERRIKEIDRGRFRNY